MGWFGAGRHPGVQNQLNPGVDLFTVPRQSPPSRLVADGEQTIFMI
jgi:hypothetical protein